MALLAGRQALVLALYIVILVPVLAAFLWVAVNARRQRDFGELQHSAYALRGWWFRVLFLILAVSFGVALTALPYPWAVRAEGALAVPVHASQFSFDMPDQLPAHHLLDFEVTAADVNHDFGIYDPSGRLIAQVQAMPTYTNRLYLTFQTPGVYTIRCLEYCGIAHHVMQRTFTVVAG
jgi:cytochrome c oxidase subunit II